MECCKKTGSEKDCTIGKQGKNWYCAIDPIKITITAHRCTMLAIQPIHSILVDRCEQRDFVGPSFCIRATHAVVSQTWYPSHRSSAAKQDGSFLFFHELPVICFQISVFKRWIELALLMKGVLLAAFLNDQSVFAENVVGRFVR